MFKIYLRRILRTPNPPFFGNDFRKQLTKHTLYCSIRNGKIEQYSTSISSSMIPPLLIIERNASLYDIKKALKPRRLRANHQIIRVTAKKYSYRLERRIQRVLIIGHAPGHEIRGHLQGLNGLSMFLEHQIPILANQINTIIKTIVSSTQKIDRFFFSIKKNPSKGILYAFINECIHTLNLLQEIKLNHQLENIPQAMLEKDILDFKGFAIKDIDYLLTTLEFLINFFEYNRIHCPAFSPLLTLEKEKIQEKAGTDKTILSNVYLSIHPEALKLILRNIQRNASEAQKNPLKREIYYTAVIEGNKLKLTISNPGQIPERLLEEVTIPNRSKIQRIFMDGETSKKNPNGLHGHGGCIIHTLTTYSKGSVRAYNTENEAHIELLLPMAN